MNRRLLDQDRARDLRRQHRLLRLIERRVAPLFRAEITRASRTMIAGLRRVGSVPELPDDHVARIADIFMRTATVATKVFGERILDQGKAMGRLETKLGFDELFDRLALEHVQGEAVRARIVDISTKTRGDIIAAVDLGQEAGLGVDKIASLISKNVDGISRQRAAVIARTETHGAANVASDGAARATGLDLQKEWMTSIDGREREAHRVVDGDKVEMDMPFIVGGESLMYPGDPAGSPENTINCRCAVGHIVKE